MIRENAIKDEEYVKDFCNKNNIEVFIKKANIIEKSKQDKKGLEETGREVRYEFFEEVLKNTNSNKIEEKIIIWEGDFDNILSNRPSSIKLLYFYHFQHDPQSNIHF